MLKLSTSQKIYFASILSKFLIFFLNKKKRSISRNKINYEIDLNEGVDLGVFLNIKNEKKIFNLKKILDVNQKLNFIDIGSNIGSVALPLSSLYFKSNIYAIEPTFFAFKKLLKNISLNPKLKKKIKALNFMINDDKNIKKVHSSWNFYNFDTKHKIHLGSLKKINTKNIISLNNLVKRLKKKIHFIKIDVDGFELNVLKSGNKCIKKNKPIIHIEFAPYLHNEFGYSTNELIHYIQNNLDYEFYDENFKRVFDIKNYVKNIKKRSENFFLINKKDNNSKKKLKN